VVLRAFHRRKDMTRPHARAGASTPEEPGKPALSGKRKGASPRGRRTRRRSYAMVTAGVALLVFLAAWSTVIVPSLFAAGSPDQGTGAEGTSFGAGDGGGGGFSLDEGAALLEGRIGFMNLIGSLLDSEDADGAFDFMNMTLEDFDLSWTDFQVTEEGFLDASTGEPLFGGGEGASAGAAGAGLQGAVETVGPEARDYRLTNALTNETVLARYTGELELEDRTVRSYRVEVRDSSIAFADLSSSGLFPGDGMGGVDADGGPGGDGPGMGDFASFLGAGSELLYDELTTYYVDAVTGIPLDLDTDVMVSMVFPDSSLMMVTEGEEVTATYGEIWVPHPTIPGAYDSIDVVIESHVVTSLLESDETIAVFESWVVYIDNSTGEPLDDQYQPDVEVYAVDRETSTYVAGYGNSERRGYHGFPIGRAEMRSYPLWESTANAIVDADFVGDEVLGGRQVYLYEQVVEDLVLESPNMILPVYRHPGLDYVYDGTTRYTIDAETGMFINVEVDATIILASPGPAMALEFPITSFTFSMDGEFVDMMVGVAHLYEDVLLPLSNEEVPVFGMQLSLTPEMTTFLVELVTFVETLDSVFNLWVPLAIVALGISLVAIGVRRLRRDGMTGNPRSSRPVPGRSSQDR
jgi:hypothetical protein